MAASGNIHPGQLEPVRAGPRLVARRSPGKDMANPMGAILTAGLMLEHLGWTEEARRIEDAVRGRLRASRPRRTWAARLGTREVGRGHRAAACAGLIRCRYDVGVMTQGLVDAVSLTPGKRVLFLTKDPELIRRQLRGRAGPADGGPAGRGPPGRHQHRRHDAGLGLLRLPARGHRAQRLRRASSIDGERLFPEGCADRRQLRGDRLGLAARASAPRARPRCRPRSGRASASRSRRRSRRSTRATTSTRACSWATTRCCARLQAGEAVPLAEFTKGYDADHAHGHRARRARSPFTEAYARGEVRAAGARHARRGR